MNPGASPVADLADTAALLKQLSAGFFGKTLVAHADDWALELGFSEGSGCYVSVGNIEFRHFDDVAEVEFLTWLDSAEWLNADEPSTFDTRLPAALRKHGAMTLQTAEPLSMEPHFRLSPDARAVNSAGQVVSDAFVLAVNRVPSTLEPEQPDKRRYVHARDFAIELMQTKEALELAVRRSRGDDSWRTLSRPRGTFQALRELRKGAKRFASSLDPDVEALQLWFSLPLSSGVPVIPIPTANGPSLVYQPRSAFERVWITLAMTAGALPAPFEMEGAYHCVYQPCGKWFKRAPHLVRGAQTFCSPRCGKSYYAARRTREARALAKAEKSKESSP